MVEYKMQKNPHNIFNSTVTCDMTMIWVIIYPLLLSALQDACRYCLLRKGFSRISEAHRVHCWPWDVNTTGFIQDNQNGFDEASQCNFGDDGATILTHTHIIKSPLPTSMAGGCHAMLLFDFSSGHAVRGFALRTRDVGQSLCSAQQAPCQSARRGFARRYFYLLCPCLPAPCPCWIGLMCSSLFVRGSNDSIWLNMTQYDS